MRICITLPTFREREHISQVIDDIRAVMDREDYDYFIHVQDDGSDDGTESICREKGCIVNLNKGHLGLAGTFRNEMRNCILEGADIIIHTDGDGQYPPHRIPDLIEELGKGYDLVIASRFMSGNHYGGSACKAWGNIIFSFAISLISGARCTDVTSGFRAISKKAAEDLKIRSDFTYTYGQYLEAVDRGLAIGYIQIEGSKTRSSRLMRHPLEYMMRAFHDILKNYAMPKIWPSKR